MAAQFEKLKEKINKCLENIEKNSPSLGGEKVSNLIKEMLEAILVDIKEIEDKDNIGKWGYFWMDERITYHDCTYGKLLDIKDIGKGNKIYISERSLGEYNHFSLTIPKHLK